jgi:hypothetical protein
MASVILMCVGAAKCAAQGDAHFFLETENNLPEIPTSSNIKET